MLDFVDVKFKDQSRRLTFTVTGWKQYFFHVDARTMLEWENQTLAKIWNCK